MRQNARIAVVIPTLNEERAIGHVLKDIPDWIDDIVVVDNGSSDQTASVAQAGGARVISEPQRGYGNACLAGMAALSKPDIIVFLDGDFSDHPEEMALLVDPILRGEADLVIGSRVRGAREPGALTPQARFGNWLSCALIRLFWGVRFSDLGPFRAIRFTTLQRLRMQDPNFGWTVEMQVKAAAAGVPVMDVPVSYRRRIGVSKISGTVRGVVLAGTKILYTILRAALHPAAGKSLVPREKLCIFTRYPEPGKTKTRLIPAIGPDAAARLQRAMTTHTLATVKTVASTCHVAVEVRIEGGNPAQFRQCFGADLHYVPQGPGDLGERMRRCVGAALHAGAESVVIIGTDVPDLDTAMIQTAFTSLRTHDLVLGPATDGGYTLIGLRRVIPELFEHIPWGTGDVLRQTMAAAARCGLSVAQLQPLSDIDRPEDLPALRRDPRFADVLAERAAISVIIPTLNEAKTLGRTLERIRHADGIEIIVVDGGSSDRTREVAEQAGAVVLLASGGRAAQQNAGGAAAKGSLLLFLHADTLLPEGYANVIRRALSRPATVAGAFRFRTDGTGFATRLMEWGTNIRSSVFHWPYGDQGVFMERRIFSALGGFASLPIMEDYELVRRLRRRGAVVTLREAAVTSGRRWQRLGILRTLLVNQLIIAGYHLGVSPDRLARIYDGAVGRDPERRPARQATQEVSGA